MTRPFRFHSNTGRLLRPAIQHRDRYAGLDAYVKVPAGVNVRSAEFLKHIQRRAYLRRLPGLCRECVQAQF